MKRIARVERDAGGTAGWPRRTTFGPLGRPQGSASDECRHLRPANEVLALRPAAYSAPAWGMARSSFYAMTSGQHAEQRAGKASGTEARDLGPGAAGGDRSRPWTYIAHTGRASGYRKVWASASGLSRHPG